MVNNPRSSRPAPKSPRPVAKLRPDKPILLSFFSGAMGLDLGLEKAGFHTVLACEVDRRSRETIAANRPSLPIAGDVRSYSASEFRKMAGLGKTTEIDLVAGGPPCQAFSTAGRRLGFNDERGNVYLDFVTLIGELRPRLALIENVRGLLSAPMNHRPHRLRGGDHPPLEGHEQPGGALAYVLELLRGFGYSVSFNLYNAANYGAAQVRERVVLVCSRDGGRVPWLPPSHAEGGRFGLKPWLTFRDAVAGIPKGVEPECVSFPEKRLRFYRLLKAGQNWRDLPPTLQREALGASFFAGGGKTGFLRRIAWDEPAPTLVTHPAMPATDLAHPEEDRPLSVQEYIVLQGFPKNWHFAGRTTDKYRQIGNAVPLALGHAIGRALLRHVRGDTWPEIPSFPYSRYRATDDQSWRPVPVDVGARRQFSLTL